MTNKEIVDYVMKTPRNTNPSVLNSLLQQRSGGSSVQPDWNQNDSTQADYIKNRPFYEKFREVELFPATEILFPDEVSNIQLNGDLVEGNYTLYVGDMVINGAYEYFGYMPWYDYGLKFEDGTTYIWGDWNLSETLQNLNGAYTVRIVVNAVIVKQIDSKYIPEGKYITCDRYQNLTEEERDRARSNLGIYSMASQKTLWQGEISEQFVSANIGLGYSTIRIPEPLQIYENDIICINFDIITSNGNTEKLTQTVKYTGRMNVFSGETFYSGGVSYYVTMENGGNGEGNYEIRFNLRSSDGTGTFTIKSIEKIQMPIMQ